jgi:hypothetical protein
MRIFVKPFETSFKYIMTPPPHPFFDKYSRIPVYFSLSPDGLQLTNKILNLSYEAMVAASPRVHVRVSLNRAALHMMHQACSDLTSHLVKAQEAREMESRVMMVVATTAGAALGLERFKEEVRKDVIEKEAWAEMVRCLLFPDYGRENDHDDERHPHDYGGVDGGPAIGSGAVDGGDDDAVSTATTNNSKGASGGAVEEKEEGGGCVVEWEAFNSKLNDGQKRAVGAILMRHPSTNNFNNQTVSNQADAAVVREKVKSPPFLLQQQQQQQQQQQPAFIIFGPPGTGKSEWLPLPPPEAEISSMHSRNADSKFSL